MSEKATTFADLQQGFPAPECIRGTSEMMRVASENVLSNPALEQGTFQYGSYRAPEEFADEMAKFLTEEYGETVSSDNLLVTCGASQGLHLLVTTLFTKDHPMFVEELSYFYGLELPRQVGMKVVPVPLDKDGLVTSEFDRLLTEERSKYSHIVTDESHPFWSMAYLIPTFHNPTGLCYSPQRCRELIALARKHKILLVCDDVYNLLYYTDAVTAPKRLFAYDSVSDTDYCGSVVSNGTFTKILSPGLRLGWIETSPPIMKLLLNSFVLRSGSNVNQYTARLMAEVLRLGLETKNIKRLRGIYKRRMNLLHDALDKHLPNTCQIYTKSQGGYFVWITLPEGLDAEQLRTQVLATANTDFTPGVRCSADKSYHNGVRLSISFCEEDAIQAAVQRLCEIIRKQTK